MEGWGHKQDLKGQGILRRRTERRARRISGGKLKEIQREGEISENRTYCAVGGGRLDSGMCVF